MANETKPPEDQPQPAPLAAEFVGLPLEDVVATPLLAAVRAQQQAAKATFEFIQGLADSKVMFSWAVQAGRNQVANTFAGPLLSMVPVPHLRIDSLTTTFRYEIAQMQKKQSDSDKHLSGDVKLGWLLSKFADLKLEGGLSGRSSEESTMNRSGSLEITVHASESEMPEGLARVLSMLASTIPSSAATAGTPALPPKKDEQPAGTRVNGG